MTEIFNKTLYELSGEIFLNAYSLRVIRLI